MKGTIDAAIPNAEAKILADEKGNVRAITTKDGKERQINPGAGNAYEKGKNIQIKPYVRKPKANKVLKGLDLFVDWTGDDVNDLAEKMNSLGTELKLAMISNRGIKVWPKGFEEIFCTDHWRCRFLTEDGKTANQDSIPKVLAKAHELGIDVIKTENLYDFDGVRGYSLGQGQ